MPKVYIRKRFLEDYFNYYCQQITAAVAKESLIPYEFAQRTLETENL